MKNAMSLKAIVKNIAKQKENNINQLFILRKNNAHLSPLLSPKNQRHPQKRREKAHFSPRKQRSWENNPPQNTSTRH